MRPLTELETQTLFTKLAHYVRFSICQTLLENTERERGREGRRTVANARKSQTGGSLKNLIAPLDDSPNADRYVFRIHKDRVYYVRLSIANLAVSIGMRPPTLPQTRPPLLPPQKAPSLPFPF